MQNQYTSRALRYRREQAEAAGNVIHMLAGLAAGFLLGAGVAGYALHTDEQPTYSLNIEIDGQLYTVDQGLSLTDCNNLLLNASDWTDGHSAYTCTKE